MDYFAAIIKMLICVSPCINCATDLTDKVV